MASDLVPLRELGAQIAGSILSDTATYAVGYFNFLRSETAVLAHLFQTSCTTIVTVSVRETNVRQTPVLDLTSAISLEMATTAKNPTVPHTSRRLGMPHPRVLAPLAKPRPPLPGAGH